MNKLKLTTAFIAAIVSAATFAQDATKSSSADFRKFQVGINVSPDYCFRVLKNNDGSAYSSSVTGSRNSAETGKLGYTAGFNFIYNINKVVGIGIGVQYSSKGYQTKVQNLTFGSMIDPRRGYVYNNTGSMLTNGKIIYNDYYMDIPLKINITLGEKRVRFIASAGVVTNIFLKETVTGIFEYEDGTHARHTDVSDYTYNQLDISPMVSAGLDWKLNSSNDLRIEPTFRYGILKTIDAPVTAYLWNAGLNVSYYFGW